jgi:hypothetical protein
MLKSDVALRELPKSRKKTRPHPMKTTTLPTRNSIHSLLLTPLLLACFAFLPSVQAAPDPAPPPGNNTRDGAGAMAHVTTGLGNTAFGTNALNTLTIGNSNAAQGASALFSNVYGSGNVAVGNAALRFNFGGNHNTAVGNTALNNNSVGSRNTAVGYGTLRSQTNVNDNVAIGWSALLSNTGGNENTAVGTLALTNNTTGNFNTATGTVALYNNARGGANTANGYQALFSNTTGSGNTSNGQQALFSNTTGFFNTANGNDALYHNTIGSENIALGNNAGFELTTGSGNIDIGHQGFAAESNTIRIGTSQTRTFIAGINGRTASGGIAVYISTEGKLGTATSSRRFKDEIKSMDKASEAILALKPVTFRYKREIDPKRAPQFGLVAEDVEKVNPDLVARDAKGEVYTVRYEAVNAMLLNEFLKEHRKVQELEATVAQQEKDFQSKFAEQQTQIEALTAGLQKVSAQLEVSKTAPQMALNNQ